jgi:hypothetical protein
VDGKVQEQKFEVKMDPRVKTSVKDLQRQHDLSLALYTFRKQLMATMPAAEEEKRKQMTQLNRAGQVFDMIQGSDTPPTSAMTRAVAEMLNRN